MSFNENPSRHHRNVGFILAMATGVPLLAFFVLRNADIREKIREVRKQDSEQNGRQIESQNKADQSEDASPHSFTLSQVEVSVPDATVSNSPSSESLPSVPISTAETSTGPNLNAKSLVDREMAASREKLSKTTNLFERLLQNTDNSLLQQFGGMEWKDIQLLQQQAARASQPDAAIALLEQAEAQLQALRPQLTRRKVVFDLQQLQSSGDDLKYLKSLYSEQERFPSALEELEQLRTEVLAWPAERWLTLAQREIDNMSPDDDGFAEIWHAVADYRRDMENGDNNLARDAERTAIANCEKMTTAWRSAESALQCLRRLSSDASSTQRAAVLDDATKLASQVTDGVRRSELLADLAGLAQVHGDTLKAASLLTASKAALSKYKDSFMTALQTVQQCRVMSAYASADQVFELTVNIPKYNGSNGTDPFAANAMAYAWMSRAASRTGDQVGFRRAMLLAEAQQADAAEYNYENVFARQLMAQADLAMHNHRRAYITANNLPDPLLRASIIYALMIEAPEIVSPDVALEVFQSRPSDHLAAPAIATYLARVTTNEMLHETIIPLVFRLKVNSSRAAVFLALARRRSSPVSDKLQTPETSTIPVADDPRSLLEAAESLAKLSQLPLERAWANIWIAACWHRLEKPASYARACDRVQLELINAWRGYWQERPAATSVIGDSLYADQKKYEFKDDYQRSRDSAVELAKIIECYITLAELQAFQLHDPERAVESCIDALRASQTLQTAKPELRIRCRSVIESVHRDCDLPAGLMNSAIDPVNNYLKMILAASQRKRDGVITQIAVMEKEGPGYGYDKADCRARAHAELALLAAKADDLETYRSARRQAVSTIESQNASDSILLLLGEADAYAGEFALAMKTKRDGSYLPLYGTKARMLSTLCVELSASGRIDDANEYLPAKSEYFWRIRAMHGIAAGRCLTTPDADPLAWVSSLEEPIDKVAAYCGLALRNPRLDSPKPTSAAR